MRLGAPPATATPLVVLAAVAPVLAVGQFRALALAMTVGFGAAVAQHRRVSGTWPVPTGGVLWAALALLLWLALSALWAAEPGRALATAGSLAAFVLLGAAAATAAERSVRAGAGPPAEGSPVLVALALGLGVAGTLAALDQLTSHALRAAVRGLAAPTPTLGFGLKPAVSAMAVLLPVVLFARNVPVALRLVAAVPTLVAAAVIPAEAARIALAGGVTVGALTRWWGRSALRWSAGALALVVLAAPLLAGSVLPRLPPLETWPRSAAHRILIYDFVVGRIAERPLLGWGGEAARSVDGGREVFAPETLRQYGLRSPEANGWFARPEAQRLPLHAHNMALQLWLELGAVGAALGAWLLWTLGRAAARAGEPAAAAGVLAAGALVGGLSFGLWQEWWWGVVLFAGCLLATGASHRA